MIPLTDQPQSVAIVSNSDDRLYQLRAPIMKKLLEHGIYVYAIAPPGEYLPDIERLGARFVPWPLDRRSVNPISEARSLTSLIRIYRRLRPDLVQHFTFKPNVYGAIAAKLAGVPVVVGGVTGLGYAFAPGGRRRGILRSFAEVLHRVSAALSDRLIFEVAHDADLLFGESGTLRSKALVVPGGSSLDLAVFSPDSVNPKDQDDMREALGIGKDALVITMASRLLYDKGILEYVKAARTINAQRSDTIFVLAGARDPGNRESVTQEDLRKWAESGDVLIAGHVRDMPCLLSISDIVVLPSYHEGIPRVLIEAAAMGRPIVSTTIPGVAEIVEDGANGTLVPPRDVPSLVTAIEELLDSPKMRSDYGAAGRLKAEREYDDKAVAESYISEYRRLWAAKYVRQQ